MSEYGEQWIDKIPREQRDAVNMALNEACQALVEEVYPEIVESVWLSVGVGQPGDMLVVEARGEYFEDAKYPTAVRSMTEMVDEFLDLANDDLGMPHEEWLAWMDAVEQGFRTSADRIRAARDAREGGRNGGSA